MGHLSVEGEREDTIILSINFRVDEGLDSNSKFKERREGKRKRVGKQATLLSFGRRCGVLKLNAEPEDQNRNQCY